MTEVNNLRAMAALVLVCTECQHTWEPNLLDPSDQAESMSIGCPQCGGWTWVGQLAERGELQRGQLP
ncbi:MAG: hypothetical protein M3186_11400 [Actinomycetota bacterium]|nr:hypothetical protein [Actinomycetota bacterium]